MSSSSKTPLSLTLSSLKFLNGTILGQENNFENDVRCRKKMRLDGDLDVYGSISYVDNQTGWGSSLWSFADGLSYNSATDSLIAKIKYIENNFASKEYVDVQTYSTARGITYYETNSYPYKNVSNVYYPFPVTTLASNTSLIFRDTLNSTMDLKFQKSNTVIGNVLTCLDSEGTVGWSPVTGSSGSITNSIVSNNGQSNSFSFKVVDTGINNSSNQRGFFVFPQILNNTYNKALTSNDFTILLGTGSLPTSQNEKMFLGPFSFGSEGLSIKGSFNNGTTLFNGETKLTGGYYNSSNGKEQSISLNSTGIKMEVPPNYSVDVNINRINKNLSTNEWTKPFIVRSSTIKDEFPVFVAIKNDQADNTISQGITLNPYMGVGNFNNLVKSGDIGLIFADWGQFFSNGGSSPINEKNYQFVIAPWSYYCDGITIRPTIQSEESSNPKPNISGYVRLTSGATRDASISTSSPSRYLELNRQGLTVLQNNSTFYGNFKVSNKIGSLLNNTSVETITSTFSVGDSSNFVQSQFYGDVIIKIPDNNINVGYVLTATNLSGRAEWKPLSNVYDTLNVNMLLTTNEIHSKFIITKTNENSSGTIIYQGDGGECNYNNDAPSSSHIFRTKNLTNSHSVLRLFYDYIQFDTTVQFPDSTNQSSAYTGAAGLSGSYTNTNLTIDDQGRITAISSNPFFLPDTISTSVTFQNNVTCNGDDFQVANRIETRIDNVYSSFQSNNVNAIYFNEFDGESPNQTFVDSTPDRNTYIYWKMNMCYVLRTRFDLKQNHVHEFQIPYRFFLEWSFRQNKQANDEQMKVWFQLDSYDVSVYSDSGSLLDQWNVAIDSPTSSTFTLLRTIQSQSGDMNCLYSTTKWRIYQPMNVINIRWAPPFGSTDYYKIYITPKGRFLNNGEFMNMYSFQLQFNYQFNESNPYQLSYYDNPPDPQCSFDQYRFIKFFNTIGQTNGTYDLPQTQHIDQKTTYPVSLSSLEYSDTSLAISNANIGKLYVNNDVLQSNGFYYGCGIAARQGTPLNQSPHLIAPYDVANNYYWSTKSWGSIFNWWWTGTQWQIWVDQTLVFQGNPNYSDYRIKENLQKPLDILNRLMDVPVYMYDLKSLGSINGSANHLGVLAHDLQDKFPELNHLVHGEMNAVDKNGSPVLQTISTEINFLLLKAIQELKNDNDLIKQEFEKIKTKIQVLENPHLQ